MFRLFYGFLKQRVLPNVDTQLTHLDEIVEELESWVKTYAYIQSLSDIAQAHYHFETIHPFSDGNGRIGRLIVLAQCLQIGIKPPTVSFPVLPQCHLDASVAYQHLAILFA
jgi:hypothetical protein